MPRRIKQIRVLATGEGKFTVEDDRGTWLSTTTTVEHANEEAYNWAVALDLPRTAVYPYRENA